MKIDGVNGFANWADLSNHDVAKSQQKKGLYHHEDEVNLNEKSATDAVDPYDLSIEITKSAIDPNQMTYDTSGFVCTSQNDQGCSGNFTLCC